MTPAPHITPRQAKILAAIVKEYCDYGDPVASRDLVEKYNFDVSPATVRSEMQALEKLGYITQPHTSAGRVPTDVGYRYFVSELMEKVKLSMKEQNRLHDEVRQLQAANSEIGRRLAKLLSAHTDAASFALLPEEISAVGLSNIFGNEHMEPEGAKAVAEFFDQLDDYAQTMLTEYSGQGAQVVIGPDLGTIKSGQYSMIVSGLQLPSGQRGVIGLIGPKSMRYPKNVSLLDYITKLLGGGTALLLLVTISKL
jgi:transcriptional regulator of heat shock response